MTPDRVAVPRLLSREPTMWLSVAAAVVGAAGVVVWGLLTQPAGNRVVAGVLGVVLVVVVAGLALSRTWLDPVAGRLVRERWRVWTRAVAWAEADEVRFQSVGGQVHLVARGAGGRPAIRVALVAADLGGERSQPPGVLRTLADQVEAWAPHRTAVVSLLRGQAHHLDRGGAVRESPLARAQLRHVG